MKRQKSKFNNTYKLSCSKFYSPDFDVLGSYTGRGLDPFDKPEQDADDL